MKKIAILSLALMLVCCWAFAGADDNLMSNRKEIASAPPLREMAKQLTNAGIDFPSPPTVIKSQSSSADESNPPEIQDILLSEGFENGGAIPDGWTDTPGDYPWAYGDGTWFGPGAPHGGVYCAHWDNINYLGGSRDTLFTPAIDFSAHSGFYLLRFWSWYPWGTDSLWMCLKEGDTVTPLQQLSTSSEWMENFITFASTSSSGQIGFAAFCDWGIMGFHIDDVKISDAPLTGRCCYGDPHDPDCADNLLGDCDLLGGIWTPYLLCAEDPCQATPPNDQCFEAQAITGPYPQTISGTVINATVDCPDVFNWNGVWYTIELPYELNKVTINYQQSCAVDNGVNRIGNYWVSDCECSDPNEFQLEWGWCNFGENWDTYAVQTALIEGPTTIYYPCYVGETPRDFIFDINVESYEEPRVDYSVSAPGTYLGNTCAAGNDCMIRASEDQIWEVTIPYRRIWTFSLCATSPAWDTYINLGNSICSNDIASEDNNCDDGLDRITINLDAGTYYLTVEGNWMACGAYQLDITEGGTPAPNDNCQDVTPVELTLGDTLTFTGDNTSCTRDCQEMSRREVWEAITINEELDVIIDYCGTIGYENYYVVIAPDCPCSDRIWRVEDNYDECEDGNITMYFYNLQPGTYYIPVRRSDDGDEYPSVGPYTMHVRAELPPPPPANDNCADATEIGLVEELPFVTTRASQDEVGDCVYSNNVWYRFTAPSTGSFQAATCGSSFDTKMAVYDGGECESAEMIDCNDDDCDLGSQISFDATEGNEYLIELGGSGGTYGEGILTVRLLPSGCNYVPGDINSNGSANGIDVTYGVTYLKGGNPPPDSCDCTPDVPAYPFYAALDVNGNCQANGIDITYYVAYLKQIQPAILYCEDCPPAERTIVTRVESPLKIEKASNSETAR